MESFLLFAEASPLDLKLRIPFSVLHFLEFAVWGAWWVVLGQYLDGIKFSRQAIGRIYATMALGAIIAPIFIGAIADKYFNGETVFGVLHLLGAVLLYLMAKQRTERAFYWTALLYALVYSPTLSLVNSVVLRHLPDATRDFPTIRVLGTIGWILANMSLALVLKRGEPVSNRPLLMGAVLSLALGIFSFTLPDTPPSANFPIVKTLGLIVDPSLGIFFAVSVLISVALAFYFSFTSIFLEKQVGVRSDMVGPLMTIGQWVELIFMFTLGWFLKEWGMKTVLTIGMAAWGVRYALFAAGGPLPLIIVGLALHGVCFDFFFAAGFIHVDNVAPADIKHTGQALFGALTYGLGMYFGTEAAGWLNQRLTKEVTDPATGATRQVTDWRTFWLIPCIGVIISLVLFVTLFRGDEAKTPATTPQTAAATE